MALSKVDYNSMNITPAASKAIKFNSSNDGIETGDVGGSLVLLDTVTVTNAGNITFDGNLATGFSSTYKEYIFKLIDIHPASDNVKYTFQVDTSGNTSYNQQCTSTFFRAAQDESATTDFGYKTAEDQANGTSMQTLTGTIGDDNDQSACGTLHIFDPTSTTFVKHFIFRGHGYTHNDYAIDEFAAGYFNTTTALDKITFAFSSGNQAGTIKMYVVT